MKSWLDAEWSTRMAAEVRQHLTPADEGSLWLLLFDDPEDAPVLATAVDGAMAHMNEQLINNVAYILDEVPANAVLLVVPRSDGVALECDRQLWLSLGALLADTETQLLDLLVVGARRLWSARRDSVEPLSSRRSA